MASRSLFGACAFVAILLLLQQSASLLQFDSRLIQQGEVWRLVTAHFVHLNSQHLLLNAVMALTLYFAFFADSSWRRLLLGTLAIAVGTSLLLMWPLAVDWYSGLSGLLHGLVCYLAAIQVRNGRHGFSVWWLLILVKLWLENWWPGLLATGADVDIPVLLEAHLAGAGMGFMLAGLEWFIAGMRLPANNAAVAPASR